METNRSVIMIKDLTVNACQFNLEHSRSVLLRWISTFNFYLCLHLPGWHRSVWFYYPHLYAFHVSPYMKYAQPILPISHEQYKLKIPSVYCSPLSHNFLSLRPKYSPYYTHTVTVPLGRLLCENVQKKILRMHTHVITRIRTAEYERN